MLGDINIGVAVALEDGLVVPVVRNADKIGLASISEQIKNLAEKRVTINLHPANYKVALLP